MKAIKKTSKTSKVTKVKRGGLGAANALDNPKIKGSRKTPCRNK